MTADFNSSDTDNWIYRLDKVDEGPLYLYIFSFYWTIQTVFTVGYGDIPAVTIAERFFAILVMLAGVFVYSFVIGAISAIFTNLNEMEREFKEKLTTLNKIQREFSLDPFLYNR